MQGSQVHGSQVVSGSRGDGGGEGGEGVRGTRWRTEAAERLQRTGHERQGASWQPAGLVQGWDPQDTLPDIPGRDLSGEEQRLGRVQGGAGTAEEEGRQVYPGRARRRGESWSS